MEHPPLRASHPVSNVTPYRRVSKNRDDPWSCRVHLRGLRIWTPPSLDSGCSCQCAAPWRYPVSSLLDPTPFLLIADGQGLYQHVPWVSGFQQGEPLGSPEENRDQRGLQVLTFQIISSVSPGADHTLSHENTAPMKVTLSFGAQNSLSSHGFFSSWGGLPFSFTNSWNHATTEATSSRPIPKQIANETVIELSPRSAK